jgi:hypothetical protein
MKCEKCGLEAVIMRTRMDANGDQSPSTQTEVWAIQTYQCRNPACGECGKDVGETHHRVYPEEEQAAGDG